MRGKSCSLLTLRAVTVALAITALAAPSALPAEPPMLGGSRCPWPGLSGSRLLGYQLGSVSFLDASIRSVVEELTQRHGIPLSFIEGNPGGTVTISGQNCTLRQLLDKIVSSAVNYRYDFIGSHLVLYPSDPAWRIRIEHLEVPAGPRSIVLRRLIEGLGRLALPLPPLVDRGINGYPDAIEYVDPVTLATPASVTELFVQLLGERESAVFEVSNHGKPSRALVQVSIASLAKSLEVTSPKKRFTFTGEAARLQVLGLLHNGERQDLTAPACGTQYFSATSNFTVTADGVVTGKSQGQGAIIVSNGNLRMTIYLYLDANKNNAQ